MGALFPTNDLELRQAFEKIALTENLSPVINKISALICNSELNQTTLHTVLDESKISHVEDIKGELLDLLLAYINKILDDNVITDKEARNFNFLKRLFKIKEGDFHNYKYFQVERVLDKQFEIMYSNNDIDNEEALEKVELQELFDLSYDQFLQLIERTIKAAIGRGADPNRLDSLIKKEYLD